MVDWLKQPLRMTKGEQFALVLCTFCFGMMTGMGLGCVNSCFAPYFALAVLSWEYRYLWDREYKKR